MKEWIKTLWSSMIFALVIVGIGGLSWSAFQQDGWVEKTLDIIWDVEVRNPLLLVPTLGGTLLMASIFLRGGLRPGRRMGLPDLFPYVLAACGVYYGYKWLVG